MRLVLVGAALAFSAYAGLTDVTYLKNGGYAADLPEFRRIDVRSAGECAAVVAQADRAIGAEHGIVCDRVPRYRHWANLTLDAYERRQLVSLALTPLRSQAVARSSEAALR